MLSFRKFNGAWLFTGSAHQTAIPAMHRSGRSGAFPQINPAFGGACPSIREDQQNPSGFCWLSSVPARGNAISSSATNSDKGYAGDMHVTVMRKQSGHADHAYVDVFTDLGTQGQRVADLRLVAITSVILWRIDSGIPPELLLPLL